MQENPAAQRIKITKAITLQISLGEGQSLPQYRNKRLRGKKMVSKTFTVKNKMGFHMRPANSFVTELTKFDSDVEIEMDGKKINGKSIMNIMASCIKCGSEITVNCSGADEEAALEAASNLIENGFGEE